MHDETLYLDYFGFSCNPFPVVPDYEKLFLSDHIDMIISELVHGIQARKGFMVLTGEIGLGKTTISRKIVSILEEKNVETSLIFHTLYKNPELLREIVRDFGLHTDSLKLSDLMRLLYKFLIDQTKQGKNCVIIIDDAQNLSIKNLELIRMISNLETNRQKLVQILLVGQPELLSNLDSFELRQLKSRIIITEEAHPLTHEELKNYILFKLNAAGNRGTIVITSGAYKNIYRYSQGNFRKINVLMDRCLYVAFLQNSTNIDESVVDMAEKDLNPAERYGGNSIPRYAALFTLFMILLIAGSVIYPDLISTVFYKTTEKLAPSKATVNTVATSDNPSGKNGVLSEKIPIPSQTHDNDATTEKASAPNAAPTPIVPEKSPGSAIAKEEPALEKPSFQHTSKKEEVPEVPPVPNALSEFLAYYDLSTYEDTFFTAMKTNRFKDITDMIYEETGHQLILLDRLPEKVKNDYAVLDFISSKAKKEIFCLFWKPTIRITKFYPSYRGEEIRQLEALLGSHKHYTYYLDGTVGARLMKAVSSFQKAQGLDVTGYPDQTTVFLLCQGG
jgi:general secretion pathway protein A